MQKIIISFKKIQKYYIITDIHINISIDQFSAHTIGQLSEQISLWTGWGYLSVIPVLFLILPSFNSNVWKRVYGL